MPPTLSTFVSWCGSSHSEWTVRKREQMGVGVRKGRQNPRPFGSAQGMLCRRKRDKDGASPGVEISEGAGQPPAEFSTVEIRRLHVLTAARPLLAARRQRMP